MIEKNNAKVFSTENVTTCVLFIITLLVFVICHYQGAGGRLDWTASVFSQAGAISNIIPQDPGSPLHLFLSKAAMRMLVAYDLSPYLYATSLSFLFSAVTVCIVFVFSCRFYSSEKIKELLWPVSLSIFLASVPIFWLQATETTIFSINTFLLAIVWLLIIKHWQEDDLLYLILAILFASLAVANHISALFILLAIIFYVIVGHKYLLKKPQWMVVTVLSLLILGVLPYNYYDYSTIFHNADSILIDLQKILNGDIQQVLIDLKSTVSSTLAVTVCIIFTLLVLGLWELSRRKLADLFAFITIILSGYSISSLALLSQGDFSYASSIAFITVVCMAWSITSRHSLIRILSKGMLVTGILFNVYFIYTSIPLKPAVDKAALTLYVHDNLDITESILFAPSQESRAIAVYYEAVTGKPSQVYWAGQEEIISGAVYAIEHLSPEPGLFPNIYSFQEKTKRLQGCCGLDNPLVVSHLFMSEYAYRPGDILSFHADGNGTVFLQDGFTRPESWGVWSDGPDASITIPLATEGAGAFPVERPARLFLTMGAYVRPENPEVQITLRANNVDVAAWDFTNDAHAISGSMTDKVIYLPAGIIDSNVLDLDFEITGAASPQNLGLGNDARALGIEITQMKLIPQSDYVYRSGDTLAFHGGGNGTEFLLDGFTQPESWGVWSDGPRASLTIPLATDGNKVLPPDRPVRLLLTMGAYTTPENPRVQVKLNANNVTAGNWEFHYDSPEVNNRGSLVQRIIDLPEDISISGSLNIEFEIEGSASPMHLGLAPDPRNLGVEITELRMLPGYPDLSGKLEKVDQDPIPEVIKPSGLVIEIRDILSAPNTSDVPPFAMLNKLTHANDGSGRLFFNDMRGLIYIFRQGETEPEIFLNLHEIFGDALIVTEFESFALHPDYTQEGKPGFGKIYTVHGEYTGQRYIESTPYFASPAEEDHHQDVIMEWQVDPGDPGKIDPGSWREIMRVGQVNVDHNTANIDFNPNAAPADPDYGNLYISFGDGGQGTNILNDEAGDPFDMGQNTSTLLGSIIRINPLSEDNKSYQVPVDNPFVKRERFLPEIWAYGFRNPLNMSWDRGGKHAMYVNDIGQYSIEEINIVERGGNYGWAVFEGPFMINRRNNKELFYPPREQENKYNPPVAVYDHSEGFAVVGGYVYRGRLIPELFGKYIFGDIKNGRIFYIDVDISRPESSFAKIHELILMQNGNPVTLLELIDQAGDRADLRFGMDEDGEIYILTKQDGVVRKIVDAKYIDVH